jgi:hypothetical protein
MPIRGIGGTGIDEAAGFYIAGTQVNATAAELNAAADDDNDDHLGFLIITVKKVS